MGHLVGCVGGYLMRVGFDIPSSIYYPERHCRARDSARENLILTSATRLKTQARARTLRNSLPFEAYFVIYGHVRVNVLYDTNYIVNMKDISSYYSVSTKTYGIFFFK